MLEVIKKPNSPLYTLFTPFSRLWFVDIFLAQLLLMSLPRLQMEIVFYNDSSDRVLHDKLYNWMANYAQDFNGLTLFTSGQHPLGENDQIFRRRNRIVEMKKDSVKLIANSEYVFGLEDDTLAPTDTFDRLLGLFKSQEDVGVASGVQQGRWEVPMIGIWNVEPLDSPSFVTTVAYQPGAVYEADGCGWYCYLCSSKEYKEALYRYDAECLGPDVCFALDMRRKGLKVLVDMDLVTAHCSQYGVFYPTTSNVQVISWKKEGYIWHKQKGDRLITRPI